jgi:hypothetical protein
MSKVKGRSRGALLAGGDSQESRESCKRCPGLLQGTCKRQCKTGFCNKPTLEITINPWMDNSLMKAEPWWPNHIFLHNCKYMLYLTEVVHSHKWKCNAMWNSTEYHCSKNSSSIWIIPPLSAMVYICAHHHQVMVDRGPIPTDALGNCGFHHQTWIG